MRRAERLLPLLVGVVALALLGIRLGSPHLQVFDEVYYANDALDLLTHGAERELAVHPPLGKWAIAAGIRGFGFTPLGWRAGPAVAGAAAVAVTWWVALRCSGSRLLATFAAVLTLTDATFFWAARLAMLDVFVALLSVVVVALLVARLRPWPTALLGGLAVGADVACKWSAVPMALVLVVVLVVRHRRVSLVLAALAVALLAYVGSYSAWLVGGGPLGSCRQVHCGSSVGARLTALPEITAKMATYDGDLKRTNVYLAGGWTWLDQGSPTDLLREQCRGQADAVCAPTDRGVHEIVDRGDVLLWLTAVPVGVLVLWRRRLAGDPPADPATDPAAVPVDEPGREPRAGPDLGRVAIVVGSALALYAPWVAYPRTFTFYCAPIVPMLAIAAAAALGRAVPQPWVRRSVAGLVVLVAAGQLVAQLATGAVL